MERVDVVVIGAGVVGLAVARALALAGREVVIVEREGAIGTGISSRNSEVIHAGLYYPAGSRKAALCVRGRELLYAYCAERGVAHQRCGKLVVATRPEDLAKVEAIAARGAANGVEGLQMLSADEAMRMEPALRCAGALWSPVSGIVDSHGLMNSLLGDAENAGAMLAVASPVVRGERLAGGWRLATGGAEPFEIEARWVINAAGLQAQGVARALDGFPPAAVAPLHLAKGHYFSLQGRAPFQRLVYPTPVDGGLGVHLTLDLGGQARFGPDVEWLDHADPDRIDYAVDQARAAVFEAEVRRFWPGLPPQALAPAYTGVRPKLGGAGSGAEDFRIEGPATHGVPGAVMLFGIESPGLTSSLAIGEVVADLLARAD